MNTDSILQLTRMVHFIPFFVRHYQKQLTGLIHACVLELKCCNNISNSMNGALQTSINCSLLSLGNGCGSGMNNK